ncbi:Mini-ribonuclease 3 [uncultured Veillonella sp.]|uniref:Mini-ribonuclease 3 n=1 Tax=uncultured Veillonella sp. TaxID=159268 RepID=UPI00262C7348|nr:ribonuclease III domain-containing protein [uncultured Veillonella sp.]
MKFKRYQFLKSTAIEKLKTRDLHEGVILGDTDDSLMLAYIGDAVFSLFVRQHICSVGITKVQVIHTLVTECICAKMQAKALYYLEEEGILNEVELSVAKRARNSNVNVPKSATVQEYRSSTAFEAVIGYLYGSKQEARLAIIMETAFKFMIHQLV